MTFNISPLAASKKAAVANSAPAGVDPEQLITGQCKVIDTTMKLHQAAKSGVVRGVNYSILLASN
jgi:hypothetical protein